MARVRSFTRTVGTTKRPRVTGGGRGGPIRPAGGLATRVVRKASGSGGRIGGGGARGGRVGLARAVRRLK